MRGRAGKGRGGGRVVGAVGCVEGRGYVGEEGEDAGSTEEGEVVGEEEGGSRKRRKRLKMRGAGSGGRWGTGREWIRGRAWRVEGVWVLHTWGGGGCRE